MDFGRICRDTRVREASFIGEMLTHCSVFRGVTVRTLTRLADRMRSQSHPAGTRIIRQGNPGQLFYLIKEGQAEVRRDPGNQLLATLGRRLLWRSGADYWRTSQRQCGCTHRFDALFTGC